jgi:hypothetical protein
MNKHWKIVFNFSRKLLDGILAVPVQDTIQLSRYRTVPLWPESLARFSRESKDKFGQKGPWRPFSLYDL